MTRLVALAAAGIASLALTAPAAAQDDPPPPPTSYFFSCTGGSPYQGNQAESWSTTKPAASFTTGAGCGSIDPGVLGTRFQGHDVDFYGGGTHSGVINAVNVELHSLLISQARARPDIGGEWELLIDGQQVAFDEEQRITGEVSSTGLTEKYVFSFSRRKPAGAPVAPPLAGPGDHTIEIRFTSRFLDYQNIWVWGASEVPGGVVVNPEKLANPKIVS